MFENYYGLICALCVASPVLLLVLVLLCTIMRTSQISRDEERKRDEM